MQDSPGSPEDDPGGESRAHTAHTPMEVTEECGVLADHNRASIHVYICEDLRYAQGVRLIVWVEGVFGLPPVRLHEWMSIIKNKKWYLDETILSNLTAYVQCTKEAARYEPFAALIKRIMEMAHEDLPGVPATYPIDDITIARNDPVCVQTIDAHGQMGAKRKPDLTWFRARHGHLLKKAEKRPASGLRWIDIVSNVEIKGVLLLFSMLVLFMATRGWTEVTKEDEEEDVAAPEDDDAGAAQSSKKGKKVRTSRKGKKGKQAVKSKQAQKIKTARKKMKVANILWHEDKSQAISEPSVAPACVGTRKRRSEDDLANDIRRREPPYVDRFATQSESSAGQEASIQAGSYALETLACTFGTRLFCVNMIIKNDKLYFWYYNACGFVHTREAISIFEDFEQFCAIIVAFACCTPERLGALPSVIEPPPSRPYPDNWPPENLSQHAVTMHHPETGDAVRITFKDPVFTQYVLAGRRTFIYSIETSPPISSEALIMKCSYQVDTRRKEHEIVDIARNASVGHLPTIHMWEDLWKMSDGVRRIFYEKDGIDYEDRIFRGIVYSKYLPLETLFPSSPKYIPIMAYQMIDCE